jgi:cytochrome c
MSSRFGITPLFVLILWSTAAAQEPGQIERGGALVDRMCAECHAVGSEAESWNLNAPPFRQLRRLMDFETFVGRLREGLLVAHPDMPTFRFTRQEATAVAAYLMSIQP